MPTSSALMIGKWQATKDRTRVYSTTGSLLKDSTDIFANDVISDTWFETYNKDDTGAVTFRADTSLTFTYKVSGNTLMVYDYGDPSAAETSKILSINATTLELESTYTSTPSSGWGLDLNTNYKFVEDDYYAKQ